MTKELSFEKLRKVSDLKDLSCESTEDINPLQGILGQDRAVKAFKFGLEIKEKGFNIYVAGYPGTGRMTAVKNFLEEIAKKKPVPSDWCYVNNFRNPYEPKSLKLPAGKGVHLRDDMTNFVSEARRILPKAFESEERQKLIAQIDKQAREQGFVIQASPVGMFMIPVIKGKPVNDQEFLQLDPKVRDAIEKKREQLSEQFRIAMKQIRELEEKANEELKKLNRNVAMFAIGHIVDGLKEEYKDLREVVAYIEDVRNDLLDNLAQFIKPEQEVPPQAALQFPWTKELPYRKYEVNIVINNAELAGAPVITEMSPTYQNLFGRIEKEAQFGVLTTDFTLIRSGSIHKANGGYIVLRAEELLQMPLSWESLKTSLTSGQVAVEEPGERLGFVAIKGLKPEPIPLNIKVVIIGSPLLYQMLWMYDMDFRELFKVKAEFDTTMDRTQENMKSYAAFICTFCKKESIKHLDASAIAKVIEHSSRLAEDQEKLSTRFAEIADIIREANFYATQEKSKFITADHIKRAVEEKVYRSNLIQGKIQEMIQRNVLLIDTKGKAVGQVNGLSVLGLGDFAFGNPSRVTASIGIGREGITDIEREAQLSGPIHTKGVMILSGYLAEKFAHDKPFSLSARLVFEQSYDEVEGDSASSTELYAILSALSGLPIRQDLAVTGSVNQKGEVQAIGGVNEKIEGFYEVCKAKGFTGSQGVMIPESNVQNLMLKEEVTDAVKAGKFHIYPVKTIDEGIEMLTGTKAGPRRPDGTFEKDTVNYLADKRLEENAEKLKEFPEFFVGRGKQ